MIFSRKSISPFLAFCFSAVTSNYGTLAGVSAKEAVDPTASSSSCKTVETVENFDLESFISAPWYIYQQAENAYLPPSRNNCVRAEYKIRDQPSVPWGYTVDVFNTARDDDGKVVDANLCAFQEKEDKDGSKLRVAPCFLPKIASGPYWVVAYEESEGYALISAGPPTRPGIDGCLTGESVIDQGLWIFGRSQMRDDKLVTTVRGIAKDAGFDISVLNDVNQDDDCDYHEQLDSLSGMAV